MVDVLPEVVMVAEDPPEAVSDAGLTVQVGRSAGGIVTAAVAAQVRATGPTNPVFVTIVILEEAVPPGATAVGLKAVADRVKST